MKPVSWLPTRRATRPRKSGSRVFATQSAAGLRAGGHRGDPTAGIRRRRREPPSRDLHAAVRAQLRDHRGGVAAARTGIEAVVLGNSGTTVRERISLKSLSDI